MAHCESASAALKISRISSVLRSFGSVTALVASTAASGSRSSFAVSKDERGGGLGATGAAPAAPTMELGKMTPPASSSEALPKPPSRPTPLAPSPRAKAAAAQPSASASAAARPDASPREFTNQPPGGARPFVDIIEVSTGPAEEAELMLGSGPMDDDSLRAALGLPSPRDLPYVPPDERA